MTQMEEAKRGVITEEMKKIAKIEKIDPEKLRRSVAKGHTVIFRNVNHDWVVPVAVGQGVRVKVNANIGTSRDIVNVEEEIEKAKIAVKYGADTIMDLSTGGDLDFIRRKIMKAVNVPVGTVPIYQAAEEMLARGKAIIEMTEDDMWKAVEKHFKDGVDFVTIHAGVTKEVVEKLKRVNRVVGMVSRGGTFLAAWILHWGEENPFYKNYEYLLELAKEYDVVLSLGDGLRPGGLPDAGDELQIAELYTIGRLVKRAREFGVQTMVEGPGHVPIDQIPTHIRLMKIASDNAPVYVLGPIVTDIFPGYDHISAAIGGAIAALNGADFLCYVTPAEHLGLPTIEHVKEGVIATKIAAHAVNLTRFEEDFKIDYQMSLARGKLNWKEQFKIAFDKEKFIEIRKERPTKSEACSMCGDLCAIKIVREMLGHKARS
ncbi:phosphomethylpyrimidine synthase [Pyrococcus furiosus DSM 3638]|uniref:Phosphomethylpyrimidine synthase n=3 Tax=Pyrococcus furiosus TaxID=2261 RepID=THIC_PYRFU|nr:MULTISPECIES: phosphomethylpyrimidine synthase ThiC [Pyrococcus]Q8U0Q4.1 RecName: Full=Phosphomethylpyrimidine synthase; AltName: Full=Hydroxymethylpyrimidine phosphate synthase; Short=HMP-P synthase; Short=HMP-phosphate synthase; Short=HMPP synthase; AltName: Full=Thiamine biosynthesis protein ThiC [Pyrococcus furiosus DSM 3638]AAL81655.1 thiamine biosynthesis protein [Pyrococcus furiosus DSM 3638]AFN04313.1 phosphomethylpyrimidine synthase ThiC [Pyrococcus furiosus COM1]MDK2869023.1 phosph